MEEENRLRQQLEVRESLLLKNQCILRKLRREMEDVKSVNAHLRAVKHVLSIKLANKKSAMRLLYLELEEQLKLNDGESSTLDLSFESSTSDDDGIVEWVKC